MIENEKNIVGLNIRKIFKEAGLSQQDVANILNVTQSVISKWLNGKPFGKNVAKQWENAFGFRANWLLTGEGDMFTSDHPKVYEYKNGVNYGNVSQSVKMNKGCVTGQVSGGQIINIPNFGGKKIIKGDGEIELQNSAQSLETWEIERNSLNQRIADLENMVNMKDEIISTLKENISLLKKLTPST